MKSILEESNENIKQKDKKIHLTMSKTDTDLFVYQFIATFLFSVFIIISYAFIYKLIDIDIIKITFECLVPSIITFSIGNIIGNIIDYYKNGVISYKYTLWSIIIVICYIVIFPVSIVNYKNIFIIAINIILTFLNIVFSFLAFRETRVQEYIYMNKISR